MVHVEGTPSVYVGTYHKYWEANSLEGKWVDLDQFSTKEDFLDYCKELHNDEAEPHFMFQDYENFPKKYYSEGDIDEKLWTEFFELDADDQDKVWEYWDEIDDDAEVQDIIDNCVYTGSFKDFVHEMIEELNIPSWVCIDYDKTEDWLDSDYQMTDSYVFNNNF